MTYRRMKFNDLFAVLTFAGVLLSNESLAACNLQETPLTNEKACARFKASDVKLNKTYKKLMSELDSSSKSSLRLSQREWIDWRDEKCDQVQEDSGCQNSLCNGVAHDICIIDLTSQRTRELEEYSRNTESAKEQKFIFSKNYK
jgi:uncharacterized protein YecT (DUF1311 family)